MFVYENVTEQDKVLYEKVSGFWYRRGSKWCVDRENEIYIVCIGKHGVETPVVFHIWFKNQLFEFIIPEPDILYGNAPKVYVRLPAALASDCSAIEAVIKRAFRETTGISDYGSLPRNIDDHIFDFEKCREKEQQAKKHDKFAAIFLLIAFVFSMVLSFIALGGMDKYFSKGH